MRLLRMVVHRKGEAAARVVACTLQPYAAGFDLGASLAEAARPVVLNHPHCARFCVFGAASCAAGGQRPATAEADAVPADRRATVNGAGDGPVPPGAGGNRRVSRLSGALS